jgi:hypothetical protein
LIEKSPKLAEAWRYLLNVSPDELSSLPDLEIGQDVTELGLSTGATYLIGFWIGMADCAPRRRISSAVGKRMLEHPNHTYWWCQRLRDRLARQLAAIKHWQIIEGDYSEAPDIEATWFIDPPYNNKAGSRYLKQPGSFKELGQWCRTRTGQVMVCENVGADWLPFRPFLRTTSSGVLTGKAAFSAEAIWTNDATIPQEGAA